jgi:hypothetical protein
VPWPALTFLKREIGQEWVRADILLCRAARVIRFAGFFRWTG